MNLRHLATLLLYCLPLPVLSEDSVRKLETLVLLPEPRAMRSALSFAPAGSKLTVLTPARETANGVETYAPEAFQALGISVDTFSKRAAAAADKRLATLKPELIRDQQGRVLYAVYRGDSPLFASLIVAPSLPKIFEVTFGKEIWVALPDRHALYVFPAQSAALADFTADLAERFAADPFAASPEIFSIKVGELPKVIASFVDEG